MLSTLLIAAALGFADTPPGTARVGSATADNIRVRLLRAGQDRTVGGNLRATFVTIDDGPPREILVRFASTGHTTHEISLIHVVQSAVSPPREFGEQARADRLDVVLSIPRQPDGLDLSRWYVVSVAPPK